MDICVVSVLLIVFLAFIVWLWMFVNTDTDFTLKLFEHFGTKPENYFRSKIVWLIGSSSGIGEHLAYEICKLNIPVKLVLSARRITELEKVKRKCLEINTNLNDNDITVVPVDVLLFEKHKEIVDFVWNIYKKVDVVVLNSGQSQRAQWHKIEPNVDVDCFKLNALAPANLARFSVQNYLKDKQQDLHFVITSSLSGVLGATSCASYVAAKHALNGYFRALQTDFADCQNLKVTICCPGLVYAPNNPLNAFTGSEGEKMSAKVSAADSLFPDKVHFVLFWTYVCLFVNQGVLVTASKEPDGSYAYNTTTVVLITECIKLLLALSLFLREESAKRLVEEIRQSYKVLMLYLIPAFLYCLYNNLAFINLHHYDPTSYFLLLNFRTVTTGIIFQFLFKKQLTRRQWLALIVLTVGCVVKQVRFDSVSKLKIELDIHLMLMLVQVFCSCFAGVYNEYLLKDSGSVNVHLMVQNVYMYLDSIFMNVGFLFFSGSLSQAFTRKALSSVARPSVLAIAVNNGIAGITTSIFLKKFNSILKTFAGAIELLLTAVMSYFLFGIAIDASMIVSMCLVSYAMYLYSSQPVINKPKETPTPEPLLNGNGANSV